MALLALNSPYVYSLLSSIVTLSSTSSKSRSKLNPNPHSSCHPTPRGGLRTSSSSPGTASGTVSGAVGGAGVSVSGVSVRGMSYEVAQGHWSGVICDPRLISVCSDLFRRPVVGGATAAGAMSAMSDMRASGGGSAMDRLLAATIDSGSGSNMSQIPEATRILSLYTNDKGLVDRISQVLMVMDADSGIPHRNVPTSHSHSSLSLTAKWKRNLGRNSNL